jgi:hypothetical protein
MAACPTPAAVWNPACFCQIEYFIYVQTTYLFIIITEHLTVCTLFASRNKNKIPSDFPL